MTLNVTNPEADRLTRQFADLEGIGVTEAIVIAMKEALATRRTRESPMETAERIRSELGIVLTDEMRRPLSRKDWDDIVGDPGSD